MMIPWGGVGCCLSAAALYLLGRSSGRDAEVLRSVARAGSMKDLAAILDTASKVLPLVVAVSGRVGSDTPLICQQSGMRGVIVEETAEQHFLKHNDAGSWIQDSAVMLSVSKEVPWYLMLGVKRTERVLPTGISLTVVGEVLFLSFIGLCCVALAIKDDVGTIRIQRPHKGPFYVSPKSIDQLIMNLGKWAKLYRLASMGFATFGAFLLAKRAIQHFLERKRRHELQKRVLNAAAQRQAREAEGSIGSSDTEPNSKKDQLVLDICVICLEQEYNAVFVP
ncbi:E3 ubiquitin-protein ligase SP1 [Zea mays]|uniref:RING-type E3 ubiquitin transferase n=1 Tax=Zea mays TaxID=4577 RepID=A0A1D6F2K5_MAIZE|nr:E3 ubiquitin-protein ligase SP1 [Zea mays]